MQELTTEEVVLIQIIKEIAQEESISYEEALKLSIKTLREQITKEGKQ